MLVTCRYDRIVETATSFSRAHHERPLSRGLFS
jgi:hypothetical protein